MPAPDLHIIGHGRGDNAPAGPSNRGGTVSFWLAGAGIVLLVAAVYVPAVGGAFILSDDNVLVRNPRLTAADGLQRIWATAESEQYQPLTSMSYWLERRLWGLRPAGYHVVNIGLHAAGALLVWRLLRRLRVGGALVAAMIFAVHPVNVESVAWIYERKNVLSGAFYFLTLLCLFRFDDRGSRAWYAAALAGFICALLSKPSTVILPPVLVLCWWSQRMSWGWRRIVTAVPFFVLAGVMAAATILYETHRTGAAGPEFAAGFAERFARAGWIVVFYLKKLVLPTNLIFIYPRWSVDPSAMTSYVPHLFLTAALVVGVAKRASWGRPLVFGLGYFVIALFPVLGFFDIYYQRISFVADHFQYLATVGIIALCVHAVAYAFDRYGPAAVPTRAGRARSAGWALGAAVVALCGLLTFQRSRIYENITTLARDTLRRNPDCWALRLKLGEHILRNPRAGPQDLNRAADHLERALRIKPDEEALLINMAAAMGRLKRTGEAVQYLKQAIRIDPENPVSRYSLGLAHLRHGELEQAIAQFEIVLRLRPDTAAAHNLLGRALCRSGRHEEGIEHFTEALRINPNLTAAEAALRNAERLLHARQRGEPPAAP